MSCGWACCSASRNRACAYGFVVGENLLIWWMEGVRCLYSKWCPLNIFSTNHSPKENSTSEGLWCLNFSFGLLRFCWECIFLIINTFIAIFNNSTKIRRYYRDSFASVSWSITNDLRTIRDYICFSFFVRKLSSRYRTLNGKPSADSILKHRYIVFEFSVCYLSVNLRCGNIRMSKYLAYAFYWHSIVQG